MSRKTERIYASADLDGESHLTAAASFALALHNLEVETKRHGREPLFDTLDVSIERATMDDRSWAQLDRQVATYTTITVSAEAVKVSETPRPTSQTTPGHNHVTRDIKPQGQCPACDAYHDQAPKITTKRNE